MSALYKLSDAVLKQRAEEGDEEAERVLQDRVIVRGLVSNNPSYTDQHWTWLGEQLCLHFKRSSAHPRRVRLILKINESMTGAFLELHWSEIHRWQKFLGNLQGPEPSDTGNTPRQGNLSGPGNSAPSWLQLDRDNDKRPYVSILVNDTLRIPEIKRYWKWVRSWHRLLREECGPTPYSSDEFLSRLDTLHENGMSYAQIARHIEEDACYRLERYMYHLRGVFDDRWVKANEDDWPADQAKHWLEECSAALYGFYVLRCPETDVSVWLRMTVCSIVKHARARMIRLGASDWSRLSPLDFVLERKAITSVVDRDKVIHALKKLKNRGKKGLGVRQNKKT